MITRKHPILMDPISYAIVETSNHTMISWYTQGTLSTVDLHIVIIKPSGVDVYEYCGLLITTSQVSMHYKVLYHQCYCQHLSVTRNWPNLTEICVTLRAIWCHLHNLKYVKNTRGKVILLVRLQWSITPLWMFFTVPNYTRSRSHGLKSCKTSHVEK